MWQLVPFLEFSGIFQPEVRRQINNPHTGIQQGFGVRHRNTMRRRKEHDIAFCQIGITRCCKRQIDDTTKGGEHLIHTGTRITTGSNSTDLNFRMAGKQTEQLNPSISRATNNTDFNHTVTSHRQMEQRAGTSSYPSICSA